jgi:hypothetical protein
MDEFKPEDQALEPRGRADPLGITVEAFLPDGVGGTVGDIGKTESRRSKICSVSQEHPICPAADLLVVHLRV